MNILAKNAASSSLVVGAVTTGTTPARLHAIRLDTASTGIITVYSGTNKLLVLTRANSTYMFEPPIACTNGIQISCDGPGKYEIEYSGGSPSSEWMSWEQSSGKGGGYFTSAQYDVSLDNSIWVSCDTNGVWKSTDNGKTFSGKNNALYIDNVIGMAQSKSNPSVIVAATKAGVWKTIDKGASWYKVQATYSFTSASQCNVVAIDSTDANKFYVASDDGHVYSTSNGGTSWADMWNPFAGTMIRSIWLDRTNGYLFAGCATGLKKWDIVGTSETPYTLTGTDATKNYLIKGNTIGTTETIYVTSGQTIAYTSNLGSAWAYTNAIGAGAGKFVRQFGVSPDGLKILTMSYDTSAANREYRLSIDSGTTWANMGTVSTDSSNPTRVWIPFTFGNCACINYNPINSTKAVMCNDHGFYISSDGGNTWTESVKSLQNTMVNTILTAPDNSIIATATDYGIIRSVDNGVTWTSLLPSASYNTATYWGNAYGCVTLGNAAAWGAGTGTIVVGWQAWGDRISCVMRSTDNGVTWSKISANLPAQTLNTSGTLRGPGAPYSIIKDPNNEANLWMAIDGTGTSEQGGIYKSTDSGASWTKTTQPAGWACYKNIYVDPTDVSGNTVLFVSYSNAGYITTNGGTSWTATDYAVARYWTMVGYWDTTLNQPIIAGGTSVHLSNNKGINDAGFTTIKTVSFNTADTAAQKIMGLYKSGSTLYACAGKFYSTALKEGEARVWAVTNVSAGAGALWTDITDNLHLGCGVSCLTVANGYLFAGTYGGGVYRRKL